MQQGVYNTTTDFNPIIGCLSWSAGYAKQVDQNGVIQWLPIKDPETGEDINNAVRFKYCYDTDLCSNYRCSCDLPRSPLEHFYDADSNFEDHVVGKAKTPGGNGQNIFCSSQPSPWDKASNWHKPYIPCINQCGVSTCSANTPDAGDGSGNPQPGDCNALATLGQCFCGYKNNQYDHTASCDSSCTASCQDRCHIQVGYPCQTACGQQWQTCNDTCTPDPTCTNACGDITSCGDFSQDCMSPWIACQAACNLMTRPSNRLAGIPV